MPQTSKAILYSKFAARAFQPIPLGLLICTQNKNLCKGTEKIVLKPNTDGIINKLVMVFAFTPAPKIDL